MKKRWIAALLAVCMVLSLCACAEEKTSEATKATEAATKATEPAKEETVPEETTAATEATQPVTEETVPAEELPEVSELVEQVRQTVAIPVIGNFGNAVLEGVTQLSEGYAGITYSNVQDEDLSLFLSLCACCGIYSYGGMTEDGIWEYVLLRPGSEETVVILADTEAGDMIISVPEEIGVFEDGEMVALAEYYSQDLTLPTGYGPNVHPQAFASFGRVEPDSQGLSDNVFGGEQEQCWREVYTKIDYATLHNYLSDMMLCGFDIWLEYVASDENGIPNEVLFTLDNGTSRIVVTYFADTDMANVFYEPGIDRYLLSGSEYSQYIPQP